MTTIGTFRYPYGAGHINNREVEFTRSPQNTVTARTWKITEDTAATRIGGPLSVILASDITVETDNLSQRILNQQLCRKAQPNKQLSELSLEAQDAVLSSLFPVGSWKLDIANGAHTGPATISIV